MDDAGDAGRGRRWRKAGKAALVAAASAVLLYLGAVLLLHTLLDSETLAGWAEPRMEAALGRDVELGGVELSVFPGLGVELHDLAVAGPADMEESTEVATLERLRLGIALLPLLRRQVRVDEAEGEGLDVRLLVAEDGRSNFGDFVPEGRGGTEVGDGGGSPLALEIREVGVDRARIAYRDRAGGRALVAEDLSGRARVERAGGAWRVDGRVEAGALRPEGFPGARRLDGSSLSLTVGGRAGPEFRWLEVSSGTARLGPMEVSVTGRVDSLRSSRRLLDLRVRAESLPVEDAAALARGGDAAARTGGTLGLDLEVSGHLGPGRRPTATGRVTLRDGTYRDAGGAVLAEALEAEAALAADSVVLRRLAGRLLGGPVEADGTLRLASGRPFAGRVRAEPRLERWTEAAGRDSLDASGRIAVDLEVNGRLDEPASTRARGTVGPDGATLRRPRWRGPVTLPGGSIRLEGDRASVSDLPVVVAGDTLRVSGRLLRLFSGLGDGGARPEVDAGARGPRLDLGALFPRDDENGPSYGRLAFAHLGGRTVGGRRAAEVAAARRLSRPGPPPVGGEVRLEVGELLYGPWRLSDVQARIVLGAERLEMRDLAFGVLGGRATGALSLGVGGGARQPFTLSLEAEEVAGRDMLARVTPLGDLLSGIASLRLNVAGALDTLMLPVSSGLEGEGRLALRDGRMRENPVTGAVARSLSVPALRAPGFDSFVLPFRVRGDSLELPSSTFRADSFSIRMDGVMGLDGRLDLSAGLELPRRLLSRVSLPGGAAGDALRKLVKGADDTGGLALGIRGTTDRPRVEVKVAPPAVSGPGGAAEKTGEKLKERARGLLDRVLGGGDAREDTAAAADSAPRDTSAAPADTAGGR